MKPGKRETGNAKRGVAKIAAPDDSRLPSPVSRFPAFRIGHGYDIHRIEPGRGLPLCGIWIECEFGVVAHSDGDIAIHALCDALLGAAALGDIGKLFPDTDEKWRGADSRALLREVVTQVAVAGWRPGNVDVTIIAQAPRIAPHVDAMRTRLAEDLGLDRGAVSVKATTHEKLDALGRKEGIAAHAVALLTAG